MARARKRARRLSPWAWFFEASPAGGTRRLVLFALAAGALGFWEISRLRGPDFWMEAFSARLWGHLLALGLVFWIGLRAAALTLQAIFHLDSLAEAQRHLLRAAFYGRYHSLVIGDGEIARQSEQNSLARVGGPGQVRVHLENAAVFENKTGQLRVLGPTPRRALIDGFERLRTVVDLRDQTLRLNVRARSRDGLRVDVQGAQVVFSIRRGSREASLRQPHPFEADAVLRWVLEERVGKRWAGPAYRSDQSSLATQGQAFFEEQLRAFIALFNLGELIAPELDEGEENLVGSANAFLARDKIRAQFGEWVETAAARRGLQLHWVDIGSWVLDAEAQEILEAHMGVPNSGEANEASSPYQDAHRQELLRLYAALPLKGWEELLGETRESLLGALIEDFRQLFSGLRERHLELKGEDEQHVETVLRFLSVLSARRQGAK